VHNATLVQLADAHDYLSSVKLDLGLFEHRALLDYLVELAPADKGHHEIQPRFILKQVLHAAEEGVVGCE